MDKIFDWLREAICEGSKCINERYYTTVVHSLSCVNEAEAKWKSDCCEWYSPEIGDLSFAKNHPFILSKEAIETFEYCPFCGKRIKVVRD